MNYEDILILCDMAKERGASWTREDMTFPYVYYPKMAIKLVRALSKGLPFKYCYASPDYHFDPYIRLAFSKRDIDILAELADIPFIKDFCSFINEYPRGYENVQGVKERYESSKAYRR